MAKVKGKIYDRELKEIEELELGETFAARSSGFPKVIRSGKKVLLIFQEKESKKLMTKMLNS